MIRAMHGGASFPATRHSVIARIREADPEARRDAFGELISGYWRPVYAHLRVTWRLAPEDAKISPKAFSPTRFRRRGSNSSSRKRDSARSYVCADRFVMNSRQSASRQKRGGGVELISLDFATGNSRM
jgi:hypothetical protein